MNSFYFLILVIRGLFVLYLHHYINKYKSDKMIKKILPDLMVVLVFIAISFAYFFPADIEGRILFQNDSSAGIGAGHEIDTYHDRTGKTTRWTNSLFGGMPTYQIAPSYQSGD